MKCSFTDYKLREFPVALILPAIARINLCAHFFYSLEQRLKKTRLPYVGPFAVTLVGCLICIVIRMCFIAVHNFPAIVTSAVMDDSPFS